MVYFGVTVFFGKQVNRNDLVVPTQENPLDPLAVQNLDKQQYRRWLPTDMDEFFNFSFLVLLCVQKDN